ncbi:PAS domain-containing sensor histidine kinase [Alicyclobacillus fastidiosus]|uniref:histidine kinase n=1 Tax=Alicyclobacillus fastidiosus TaxID=392011 RepID=A0ABV5AL35_9BACL|nr:PAS domain-containing sensor histidine kinase [Alicyclobacillus fastidiosus]WEH08004.1 PAS domain-containing protein [Alicyclobacillus fastidiosus]
MFRRVEAELTHALQVLTDIQVALSEACIVTIIDQDGRLTYVNDKYCRITGFVSEEVLGQPYQTLIDGDLGPDIEREMCTALSNGRVWSGEIQSRSKNGAPLWVQSTVVPFMDDQGKPHQFISVSTDITDRKRAEEAQREREQQLYTLINAMPDVVLFKDDKGRWLEANETALRLFEIEGKSWYGKTMTEIMGSRSEATTLVHEDDTFVWERGTAVREEASYMPVDAVPRTFDTITIPIYRANGGRHRLLVIGRDITERKRHEQEVKTLKEEFESIFNYSADAICLFDLNGMLLRTNQAFETMYGWSGSECVGCLLPLAEWRQEVSEWLQAVSVTGCQISRETVRRCKDGESIYVSVTLSPLRNADGDIVAVSTIERDITERVRTSELLLQSEKLSVAGQLAAGIAHELRNPMTVLRGFTQIIQSNPEKTCQYTDVMLHEFDRVNSIVEELLTLAKPQAVKYENKDIVKMLEHVALLLETQAVLRNIRVVRRFCTKELVIPCVEHQMKQVFMNILKNAIEASHDNGEIEISVEQVGDCAELRFVDHGCGIPSDQLRRIGEPFHTTKPNGTGLGLLVTHRIISEHKGTVLINSQVNFGTEVRILMPVPRVVEKQAQSS